MGARRRVRAIGKELRRHVVPERRERARSYFASRLEVLGVPMPAIRAVARTQLRELRGSPADEVVDLALELVEGGVHECRQVGWEILTRRADAMARLRPADVEALGSGNDNWASVDAFAVLVAGPAWRAGRVADADVLRWAASDDPWWRRTALSWALSEAVPHDPGSVRRFLDRHRAELAPRVTREVTNKLQTGRKNP